MASLSNPALPRTSAGSLSSYTASHKRLTWPHRRAGRSRPSPPRRRRRRRFWRQRRCHRPSRRMSFCFFFASLSQNFARLTHYFFYPFSLTSPFPSLSSPSHSLDLPCWPPSARRSPRPPRSPRPQAASGRPPAGPRRRPRRSAPRPLPPPASFLLCRAAPSRSLAAEAPSPSAPGRTRTLLPVRRCW